MNTVLGDALQKAGVNESSNFVWKGEKRKEGDKYVQDSKRFVDMTPEELAKCYKHCDIMLWNDDPKHLGRYNVLEEVLEQINCCNVELLVRYYENSYMHDDTRKPIKRYALSLDLRKLMYNNE